MNNVEPNTVDVMDINSHVMVLPSNTDQALFEEGSHGLHSIICNQLMKNLYSDVNVDICSSSLRKLSNGNMIFTYKAVPATASTMSSYSHKCILVVSSERRII